MQALRVDGIERFPRLTHDDPTERSNDRPVPASVDYPLVLVE